MTSKVTLLAIFSLTVGICSQDGQASLTCPSILVGLTHVSDGHWRKSDGSRFGEFRANAPHMIKALVESKGNSTIQTLSKFKGTVIGDFHQMNLNEIELADHSRELGVVDVDDGGVKSPLIIDLLRGLIGMRLSDLNLSMNASYEAYMNGLLGHKAATPQLMRESELRTAEEFKSLQSEWLKEIVHNEKFSDSSGIDPIDKAPSQFIDLFEKVKGNFEASLVGKPILDFGFKIKKDGGSQGLPRFLYLVTNPALPMGLEVLEFKYLAEPAASLAGPQPGDKIRIAAISKQFRPHRPIYGTYKVIETSEANFLLRTRTRSFIDVDFAKGRSESERHDLTEYQLYLMNYLGQNHRSQLGQESEMISVLSKHETKEALFEWCENYLKLVKQQR